MKRTYVRVECLHLEDGVAVPKKVIWRDGREWEIKRVVHSCTSMDGQFEGIRYTIIIGHAEKYIYQLGSKWYVNFS